MRRGRSTAGLVLGAFSGALTVLPWLHTLHHRDDHVHVDGAIVFLDAHEHDRRPRTSTTTRTRKRTTAGPRASIIPAHHGPHGRGRARPRRGVHPRRAPSSCSRRPPSRSSRRPTAARPSQPALAARRCTARDARTAARGVASVPKSFQLVAPGVGYGCVRSARVHRKTRLRRAKAAVRRAPLRRRGPPDMLSRRLRSAHSYPRSARCPRPPPRRRSTRLRPRPTAAAPDEPPRAATASDRRRRAAAAATAARAPPRGPLLRPRPSPPPSTRPHGDGRDRRGSRSARRRRSRSATATSSCARSAACRTSCASRPGLVLVQHAGGGKANQYFLRGFDADHGTDVALSIDGVPINMVSHAHGQGFADTNFIIPEVVERVEITKGPYFAYQGDLAHRGRGQHGVARRLRAQLRRRRPGRLARARRRRLPRPARSPARSSRARLKATFAAEIGPHERPVRQPGGLGSLQAVQQADLRDARRGRSASAR